MVILAAPALALAALPPPSGFVNDLAGVMDPQTKSQLENYLSSFNRQTGVEVAIATLPSLDGRTVEDVAVQLFKEWGVGKKGKDNGILFLVAPAERKMRIEVGYGLEGAINDATAGRILDGEVLPRFRAGEMAGGIAAGAVAIVSTIVEREKLTFDSSAAAAGLPLEPAVNGNEDGPPATAIKILVLFAMIFVFIRHPWLFLFFLTSSGRGGGSGGGFGGGVGGGGFGGFGGGMSGGGGASRGW